MSNSTSLTSLQGPGKYQSTMDAVTGSGKLGQLHQSFDNSAEELLMHRDNLELTGEGYETRGRKFTKTVKTFFKAGGDVGALVGTVTMLPSDLLVGRGNKSSGRPSLTDEGILGNGANFVGSCVSGSVEFVGKGVGGAAAVVAMPAKDVEKDTKEWLRSGIRTGGSVAGTGTGHLLGTAIGTTLDVARVPSLVVKGVLKGTFAVVSGTIGVVAGVVRAVINR